MYQNCTKSRILPETKTKTIEGSFSGWFYTRERGLVLGLDSCRILVGEGETLGSIEVREKVPFSFSKHEKKKKDLTKPIRRFQLP